MIFLVTVLGIVQGVGYRPFVARLAQELGVTGTVRNSGGIVYIQAQGDQHSLDLFIKALSQRKPPGAEVTQVLTEPYSADKPSAEGSSTEGPLSAESSAEPVFKDFRIIKSTGSSRYTPLLPADLPVCGTCLKELSDPQNRRFGYSFISCTDCGPRYSIMEAIPYDRDTITMNSFPMCPSCEKEYTGDDRRRHAQTISCHDCGPQLILTLAELTLHKEAALARSIDIINRGGVLAVKGIGGYQFACRPDLALAVDALRKLKNRGRKPFAVMFPNLESIKRRCTVSPEEEKLLLSAARPIVLLASDRSSVPAPSELSDSFSGNFCPEVSGESRFLGAFLPYTALHQQLTDACGPLIMTSANLSDEPIRFRDEDIMKITSPYLSGVLYNTRRIVTPLDDSIVRAAAGRPQMIRRSRGYVPSPIFTAEKTTRTIFAAGGDLKSSFCLYQNGRAYVSQYFGDMDSYEAQQNYRASVLRMQQLFRLEPDMIACDLHPLYRTSALSAKMAAGLAENKPVRIQHHHAHAASVMAEHGIDSCIGVIFDGTGYGTDGAVWGGEFLRLQGAGYTREAHLSYVTLCGGDEAARRADLAASCYLAAAGEEIRHKDAAIIKAALLEKSLTQQTSSMGRLFDAVSAVLGIRLENSYEGECAVMLENAAAEAVSAGILPFPLHFPVAHGKDGSTADPIAVLSEIYRAFQAGCDRRALALGFHMAIVEMVVSLCRYIREKSLETRVVLSGGVFANMLLTEKCTAELEENGFAVYLNESVPANDGGISLGQAWICGQMVKKR